MMSISTSILCKIFFKHRIDVKKLRHVIPFMMQSNAEPSTRVLCFANEAHNTKHLSSTESKSVSNLAAFLGSEITEN